jgi:arginyl-tRNA synthetase
MNLQQILTTKIQEAVQSLFDTTIERVEFQATRRDFEGDITFVIFPLVKVIKGNPVEIGNKIGEYLVQNTTEVVRFNVVSGFLNIVISDKYYLDFFDQIKNNENFGSVTQGEDAVMVEYASPNTNKPLHLGHVRNVLLGYSVAQILKASGKKVYKTQVINDRGIHICKSMLAWQKFGNGETPQSTGLKGDKLVGNYYVAFDKEYKNQINELIAQGKSEEEAKKQAPIMLEAQQMLLDWEAGKPEVLELWNTMNSWVYDGFDVTYKNIGVDFDKNYYESNTYLLGKDIVEEGLSKGVFYKKEDGSVWIDLTSEGLDEKLVLRSDGTSVYITQDIGTAIQRVKDFPDVNGMVYTVGNEQDYHFKVLFLILKKLGYSWAENLYHLSYGMVDLPSGKMKSREGTVVDADDLISDMESTAREISEELGKLDGYSEEDKTKLYKTIGLGALKYYILKVDPKKRILFNPQESVDFAGNTGPFIQYTYARIQSILRKADFDISQPIAQTVLSDKEKEIIKQIAMFPEVIQNAAATYSPALIANYVYDLVKEYNSFYQTVPILAAENQEDKVFRVQLSKKVGDTIKSGFSLLGIDVPERM